MITAKMKFNFLLYPTLCLVVLISACSTQNSQNNRLAGENQSDSSTAAHSPANSGDTPTAVNSGTAASSTTESSTSAQAASADAKGDRPIRILYLGDSITAGFGLGEEQAFPHLVQQKAMAAGFNTVTINAGVSGDTSTGGLNRIGWLLKNRVDILFLELGGNDGLRGVDLTLTAQNLSDIIKKTKQSWPNVTVVVAGMMVPPNLGHEYTSAFRDMFPAIAGEHGAELIPFVLEGVGGIKELNMPDGIHPTAEGHRIVSETVWATMAPLIENLQHSDN